VSGQQEQQPPHISGYRHLRFLDRGGCSTVYLYEEQEHAEQLNREVAVKVLTDLGMPELLRQQFTIEAQSMAKLGNHPNIVQILKVGELADGRPYIVMQYYPNPNTCQVADVTPFTVAEALEIGVKVASAVEAAHGIGVLHRDIKPSNVLIDEYGQPGLTDFGIAGRVAAGGEDDVGLSIPWSPPEALDRNSALLQSDVYSLAATVWHLLVGRSPFDLGGDNSVKAIQERIRTAARPATGKPGVPPSLDRLLQQAMAIDPADRPGTAIEFAKRLQEIEVELGLQKTAAVIGVTRRPGQQAAPAEGVTRLRAPVVAAEETSARDAATRLLAGSHSMTYLRPPHEPLYAPRAAAAQSRREPHPRYLQPSAPPDELGPMGSVPRPRPQSRPPDETRIRAREPEPEEPPAAVERPKWLWPMLIAAAVVVLATIGLFQLLDSGSPPAAAEPSATQTASGQDAGVPGANVPPGQPTVVAKQLDATTLRFTWMYSAQLASDTFSWQTADGADSGTVSTASLDLARPSEGNEVCVQVKVVRADGSYAATGWSPAVCGS